MHDRARPHPPSLSRLEASRAHMGLAAAARGGLSINLERKGKQMETIPKERLQRIGIQGDIYVTIKPSSIIIPFAAYGSIAVAAAVIIYLFLHMDHHGIVTKIQYNGCGGQCALGSWSGRNGERGADWDSKATELRGSYLSDVPRIDGVAWRRGGAGPQI
jgi:hypothetical protein